MFLGSHTIMIDYRSLTLINSCYSINGLIIINYAVGYMKTDLDLLPITVDFSTLIVTVVLTGSH